MAACFLSGQVLEQRYQRSDERKIWRLEKILQTYIYLMDTRKDIEKPENRLVDTYCHSYFVTQFFILAR
jgi:hypothetical protein